MDRYIARLQALFSAAKNDLSSSPFWVRLTSLSVLLLIGFTAIAARAYERYSVIKTCLQEVASLEEKAILLSKQKKQLLRIEEQNRAAAKNYLKEQVEALPLLQDEKKRVGALSKQFPDNHFLKERLHFLESDQNQIHFDAEAVGNHLKLKLSRRVQMDLDDLKRFVEAIEGDRYDPSKQKPFLIIKKFDLLKCYEKGDEKVYSIHMEMLQKT